MSRATTYSLVVFAVCTGLAVGVSLAVVDPGEIDAGVLWAEAFFVLQIVFLWMVVTPLAVMAARVLAGRRFGQ